ncbi:MAG: hypothetical protein AAF652_19935 [Cyanobacteria bacterium P01_C01_bin.72]
MSDNLQICDLEQTLPTIQIETYTYAQAQEELGIGVTTLRERIKTLRIVPERRGKTPILTSSQVQQIRALNEHLAQGGSIANFTQFTEVAELKNQTLGDTTLGIM